MPIDLLHYVRFENINFCYYVHYIFYAAFIRFWVAKRQFPWYESGEEEQGQFSSKTNSVYQTLNKSQLNQKKN